jgi:serine phosphatase RsbU (regulator of sigma subunit)
MAGRGGLLGLLALGPRLSEELYSREDLRLLASVAAQSATALENIRLAGEIAERLEAERRTAREMEIAREVQSRLLPQSAPSLRTLECAAQCIQARSVGGDYYDFLRLGDDRLGLVLADVSGKGVHAALLMANLQAHLRSQGTAAANDPAAVLRHVNRMLWESTGAQHYATLFFGIYDDRARRLTYVNCGHNPPVLLSGSGHVRRLEATATVVGMFEQWDCSAGEEFLEDGDLLAIFSDGVTEAMRNEEEFGELRLIAGLCACRQMPAERIVSAILADVQAFSAGTQSDDLTLLIARACAQDTMTR